MVDDKHSEIENDNDANIIRYWRFKPEYLRTVDLGFGIDKKEEMDVLNVVSERYPHVRVRRLEMSQQGYSFGLNPLN
jgi:hypothetical protein